MNFLNLLVFLYPSPSSTTSLSYPLYAQCDVFLVHPPCHHPLHPQSDVFMSHLSRHLPFPPCLSTTPHVLYIHLIFIKFKKVVENKVICLCLLHRCSQVFNASLSNLPDVLDHNFGMGALLMPSCLPVLQFRLAPHQVVDICYHPLFFILSTCDSDLCLLDSVK